MLELLGELIPDRDIIVFEQRGAAERDLFWDCNDLSDASVHRKPGDYAAYKKSRKATLENCTSAFAEDRSIDLRTFTLQNHAADIDSIRQALNIDTWAIIGISHGATVAAEMLRSYPDNIKRAVLGSFSKPGTDKDQIRIGFYQALQRAFRLCEENKACTRHYPNFRKQFVDNISELDLNPTVLDIDGMGNASLDGLRYLGLVWGILYDGDLSNNLPAIVDAIHSKNNNAVSASFTFDQSNKSDLRSDSALPILISYACNSFNPDLSPTDFQAVDKQEQPLLDLLRTSTASFFPGFGSICETLGLNNTQAENKFKAFESDDFSESIPVFLITSDFDPVTPLEQSRSLAKLIKNSHLLRLPIAGHGQSLIEPCSREHIKHFLSELAIAQQPVCAEPQPVGFTLPGAEHWHRRYAEGIAFQIPSYWKMDSADLFARPSIHRSPALSQGSLHSDVLAKMNSGQETPLSNNRYFSILSTGLGVAPNELKITDTGETLITNKLSWTIHELVVDEVVRGWLGLTKNQNDVGYVLFGFETERLENERLYSIGKAYDSVFLKAIRGFLFCGATATDQMTDENNTKKNVEPSIDVTKCTK